jgi:hypothetical protein
MIEQPREEIWDLHPRINNYHPRPMLRDKNISVSSQEFILIPTLAYRVSAPEIKINKLNALQKVILRFCRAGEYRPAEISNRLNIHVEFAVLINDQLQKKGLIDTKGSITETGTEALKMEEVQSDNLVTGWILKDTIQNRLWPRFVKDANRVESSISESESIIVDLGTPGKPRAVQCWKINMSSPNYHTPNPNEIMEAMYQNGRDFDSHGKKDGEVGNQHNLKPADLKRVQIIDPTPRRVHLLSYIYVAKEDPSRFFAADPFGKGNSRFFFDSLRVERKRYSALDDFLNRYVEKNRQRVIDRCGLSSPELDATNREALKNRYGWNQSRLIGFSKIMYAPLLGVEMQYALLEAAEKKKLATELLFTKVLLNQCRISFEAFIAAMLEWYPPHEPWRKFYKEKVRQKGNPDPKSREIAFIELEKVYRDLGCDPADIDDRFLPNRSRKYDPSKLKEATHLISKGRYKGGLNHLINILAIEAEKKPDHPFREILEVDQCWDSMVFLMDAGNEGSHYKKPSAGELKTQDAYRAREQIHLLVKKLTEVSAMNKELNQQKVVT